METDREVLMFFHERLQKVHNENELLDYMHRLRWIIAATPPSKISRGQGIKQTCNSFKDLGKILKKKSVLEKSFLEYAKEN